MTDLPNGWSWSTIGEVCEKPKYGWTTSASDIGEVKLLRTTDLTHGPITWETVPFCKETPKTISDFEVHPNDIFVSRAGSVGVSVLVKNAPFKTVFASYLIRIRPTNRIDAKYLSLFLQSPHYWNQVLELSSGIALANINATKIQSMTLPLPPLEEQHKIVEILENYLTRLDDALADVKQAKIKAAQFRRSILQAAFSGNLSADGTSSGISLPEDWEHLSIGSLCESVTKIDPINLGRDSFKYVDIGALEPSSGSLANVVSIPTIDAPGRARQLLAVGDSIFATVRPYMKKVAYISQDFDGEIASTGFCVLRPIQEKLHSRYLYYFLLSDNLLDQVLPLQRGVSYPAIRDNDLRNASIALPPIKEQQRLVTILEDHFTQLEPIVRMADVMEMQATDLKRSLLQSAFTGQLTKEVVSV